MKLLRYLLCLFCFSPLIFCANRAPKVQNKNELQKNINDGIASLQELLNLIYQRYEIHTPLGELFMMMMANMALKDWDLLKYSFIDKILQESSSYVMVFGGSSVTAGHDNLYNQSYPMIFKKRMESVFRNLKIDLVVHNIAQGANDCLPSDLCYETMGGFQSDFYSWEQSFNCGRSPEFVDTVAYLALKKGASYYIASSGSVMPTCNQSTDPIPYSYEDWNPKLVPNLRPWTPTSKDINKIKQKMIELNSKASSAERYAPIIRKYLGMSGSGVNMWTQYPKAVCQDIPGTIFEKECTASAVYESCKLKFLTADLKIYGLGRGAAWHPTRAIHLLRGEVLVWLYGVTLLDAMYAVKEMLIDTSPEQIFRDNSNQLSKSKALSANVRPSCEKDPLNCHLRAICFTDYTPRYSNLTLQSILVGTTKWTSSKTKIDAMGQSRPLEDLESRPSYLSHHGLADGEIYFQVKIPSSTTKSHDFNKVLLCGYRIAEHKEGIFGHVEYKVDLNVKLLERKLPNELVDYTPSENRIVWTNHTKESFYCHLLKDLPPGNHVIGLESKENKPTGLTHVVTWKQWIS